MRDCTACGASVHTAQHTIHAGSADVVSVGCVSIGDSSRLEISQLTSDNTSGGGGGDNISNWRGVDPVISAADYDLYTEQLEECRVVFEVVNPHSPAYKTVVIRNYRSASCVLVHLSHHTTNVHTIHTAVESSCRWSVTGVYVARHYDHLMCIHTHLMYIRTYTSMCYTKCVSSCNKCLLSTSYNYTYTPCSI